MDGVQGIEYVAVEQINLSRLVISMLVEESRVQFSLSNASAEYSCTCRKHRDSPWLPFMSNCRLRLFLAVRVFSSSLASCSTPLHNTQVRQIDFGHEGKTNAR